MSKTVRRERSDDYTVPRAVRRREWKQDRQSWKSYAREILGEDVTEVTLKGLASRDKMHYYGTTTPNKEEYGGC